MAIKIEEVAQALRSNQIPTDKIRAIVEILQDQEDSKKNEKEPGPKKQFVLITNSTDTGFAVQIEETEDAGATLEKIKTAARAYNNSRKGQKTPVRNVVDALLNIPAKFLVEVGVWRKTKEAVRTLSITDGGSL